MSYFDEKFVLESEAESERFAVLLAHHLTAPMILTFSGEIGRGKTTIIRALLRASGVTGAIKSPTYTLVESYVIHRGASSLQFNHFDLYRISHSEELEYLGFREYFAHNAICCIEWPDKALNLLGPVDVAFELNLSGAGRTLQARAHSHAGDALMMSVKRQFYP